MMTGPNQPSLSNGASPAEAYVGEREAEQVNWLMHIQLQIRVTPLGHISLLIGQLAYGLNRVCFLKGVIEKSNYYGDSQIL